MVNLRGFAVRLAIWRKKMGKTQAWLAEELGCSQSYISQIERAENAIVPGAAHVIEIYRLRAKHSAAMSSSTISRASISVSRFIEIPLLVAGPISMGKRAESRKRLCPMASSDGAAIAGVNAPRRPVIGGGA